MNRASASEGRAFSRSYASSGSAAYAEPAGARHRIGSVGAQPSAGTKHGAHVRCTSLDNGTGSVSQGLRGTQKDLWRISKNRVCHPNLID
jgi:hypothetical protein